MYAALRDIETSLSLCPSHKLSQQRRIQCLLELGMVREAGGFLKRYQLDHPSDAKFVAKTSTELEKGKKEADTGMCVRVCGDSQFCVCTCNYALYMYTRVVL